MLTLATTPTTNEKQGNGRFSTLRKRKRQGKNAKKARTFSYLSKNKDLTMKFSNAKDPIYVAFDCLEQRSLAELMCDFVQDSLFEITRLVSKVVS